MTKYYRVRSQEQCDWLKNKLEIEDDLHVSNFPVTILYGDVICGIYRYHDDPEPLIEVSQMMEDSRMKAEGEPMTEIILDDLDQVNHGVRFENNKKIKFVTLPTSKLYPKVKMTQAEKDEFDKVQRRRSATALLGALRYIDIDITPILFKRLFNNGSDPAKSSQAQNEFARAWADPSLIEVILEKKWNVKVPPFERTHRYYYKEGMELHWASSGNNDEEDQQFTADELKEYGLDDDMYEKEEVTDDGTK